jgi:hypothetical protein
MKRRSYLMRMNENVRLIGILVLAMLVLASVQVVGAQDEITWYWKDTDVGADFTHDSHVADKYMDKIESTGNTATVTLSPDISSDKNQQRGWWYANETAQVELTFPENVNWDFTFWVKVNGTVSIFPRVCKVGPDGSTTYITKTGHSFSISGDGTTIVEKTKTVEPSPDDADRTFAIGDRLAIEIYASLVTGEWVEIYYNSSDYPSRVTYLSSEPAYPVPELSTIILFSTGLIALAGYVLLKRR